MTEEVELVRDLLLSKRQGILLLERVGPFPEPALRASVLAILAREARHCALLQDRLRALGVGVVLAPTPAPPSPAPGLGDRVRAFSNAQQLVADRIASELDGIRDPLTRELLAEVADAHRETIQWCREVLQGLVRSPDS